MPDLVAVTALVDSLVGQHDETDLTLAVVVQHQGEVVVEAYADGVEINTTHISWSMAKSITHALVGIAVKDGLLDINAPTGFEQWQIDQRQKITIQDLLEMRSGLAWVEDYVDANSSDVIEMLFGSGKDDHASFAIDHLLADEPGTKWLYSSGTTNIIARLLGNALADKYGETINTKSYIQKRLFDPLGMTNSTARFDAAGTFVGSSYVYATARDFARFGELYLRDGVCNGNRILPLGWVEHARSQIAIEPDSGLGYGAHWWILQDEPNSLVASGYEGQQIYVLPARDLVIVRLGKTDETKRNAVRASLKTLYSLF